MHVNLGLMGRCVGVVRVCGSGNLRLTIKPHKASTQEICMFNNLPTSIDGENSQPFAYTLLYLGFYKLHEEYLSCEFVCLFNLQLLFFFL